jgi:hypothetical protein
MVEEEEEEEEVGSWKFKTERVATFLYSPLKLLWNYKFTVYLNLQTN